MIPARFGESQPFSLGVEEELMILDASTFEQVAAVDRILNGVEGQRAAGTAQDRAVRLGLRDEHRRLRPVADVDAALPALRRAAAAAAAREGLAIAAAATHPFAKPEGQPIVKEQRYVGFVALRRAFGAPAGRAGPARPRRHADRRRSAGGASRRFLPWLPVVLALSANSPWYSGELTGMASNRAPVLAELPRAGGPPGFASYAEWESWVERLVSLGVTQDYTRIWWDVRPHPALGTLEVRIPDQPTDVRLSSAFAALLQAMCATALADGLPRNRALLADRGRADYAQNRWAAARSGPGAELLHPAGDRVASAASLGAELIELVRPAARALGGEARSTGSPRGAARRSCSSPRRRSRPRRISSPGR